MADVPPELGRTVEVGFRKARVDRNRVPDEPPVAVFKHTFYLGRWYYDGYAAYATEAEAVTARDTWLNQGVE